MWKEARLTFPVLCWKHAGLSDERFLVFFFFFFSHHIRDLPSCIKLSWLQNATVTWKYTQLRKCHTWLGPENKGRKMLDRLLWVWCCICFCFFGQDFCVKGNRVKHVTFPSGCLTTLLYVRFFTYLLVKGCQIHFCHEPQHIMKPVDCLSSYFFHVFIFN